MSFASRQRERDRNARYGRGGDAALLRKRWIKQNVMFYASQLFTGADIVRGVRLLESCTTKVWKHQAGLLDRWAFAPECEECAPNNDATKSCELCLFVRSEIWARIDHRSRKHFFGFLAACADPVGAPQPSPGDARPPEHWD